jgi:hypothetical protein
MLIRYYGGITMSQTQTPTPNELNSRNIKNDITDFVKKNPWMILVVVAGLGFVFAKIFSRKKT